MPRLLILGCGRSGTRYVTKVLGRLGLRIGHETPGRDGMASWMSVGREEDIRAHDVVWHQVREPVGVVASFCTVMRRTWTYVCDVEPRVPRGDPLLLRSMKYWLYWNDLCESAADRTYRVEAVMDVLPLLAGELGVELTGSALEAAGNVPKNDHTRQQGHAVSDTYPDISWGDLEAADASIAARMRAQAERYGYEF